MISFADFDHHLKEKVVEISSFPCKSFLLIDSSIFFLNQPLTKQSQVQSQTLGLIQILFFGLYRQEIDHPDF